MDLSDKTKELIEKAGWFAGRKIDIMDFTESLKKEGYEISEVAVDFMQEFGGLEVYHPHHKVKDETDRFYIDPIKAIESTFIERIREYEFRVGEKLTLVGKAFRNYMPLAISPTGKVYCGYDDTLIRLGNSGYEAIQTLCEGIQSNIVNIE